MWRQCTLRDMRIVLDELRSLFLEKFALLQWRMRHKFEIYGNLIRFKTKHTICSNHCGITSCKIESWSAIFGRTNDHQLLWFKLLIKTHRDFPKTHVIRVIITLHYWLIAWYDRFCWRSKHVPPKKKFFSWTNFVKKEKNFFCFVFLPPRLSNWNQRVVLRSQSASRNECWQHDARFAKNGGTFCQETKKVAILSKKLQSSVSYRMFVRNINNVLRLIYWCRIKFAPNWIIIWSIAMLSRVLPSYGAKHKHFDRLNTSTKLKEYTSPYCSCYRSTCAGKYDKKERKREREIDR